jgi:hypothetical protein
MAFGVAPSCRRDFKTKLRQWENIPKVPNGNNQGVPRPAFCCASSWAAEVCKISSSAFLSGLQGTHSNRNSSQPLCPGLRC